ncbi:response regulator [Cryomorphaceae bacterium]|nr:response regulator [Cryomorphaceae bacterium]
MSKTVLVIDDEPVMRKLLEQFLNKKYEVTEMDDGKSALQWLYSGNIPHLIVADLNMPEINGFEFLEKVRGSDYFESVPIIILSGEESSTERIKCLKLGANDYIIKPFNPEELMLRIDNLLTLIESK